MKKMIVFLMFVVVLVVTMMYYEDPHYYQKQFKKQARKYRKQMGCWQDYIHAVSYTHLTLPTNVNV